MHAHLCPGPLSRRDFLRLGAFALGGMGIGNLLGLRAAAKETGRSMPDTSVIFLWLPGGPPHLETYDPKPDAPAEYRGEFRHIKTNVSGMEVCELLPLHAKVADKFALIRSIAHTFADHGGGHKRFLTGYDPREATGFVNDHPMVGSVVAKSRENLHSGIPNYIAVTDPGRQGIDVFSFGSAYLGPSSHPFIFAGDPSDPKFRVPNLLPNPKVADHLFERLALRDRLDTVSPETDAGSTMTAMDASRERAVELLRSSVASKAFDLTQESPKLRDRYGLHAWGQRCLLARRLVEQGASFVTMVLENPYQSGVSYSKKDGEGIYNWDSHAVNCHIFNDARIRLPIYDRCVTALIEDLYARGLDKKVLLIVTGEFGRTPRIEYNKGTANGVRQPGRDHWPHAMSVLVAGGGLRVGQVVGSTNSKGEHPKDRPLTPNDLWATMFRHLGIDWCNTSFLDHSGRPLAILPYGEPITELM
jgi:hypothetical protein